MKFRPCIDIHNGKVKQIVGGTLQDEGDQALENFVSVQDAAFYARLYRQDGLSGGHIILLNGEDSPYYQETERQALAALAAYPGGLQVGGGIWPGNSEKYLRAGASHVIVTSYVFRDGRIDGSRLKEMERAVGRERLVLDISCRRREGAYVVVTDRWQKFTEEAVSRELLEELGEYCDEFLIHGVDAEGRAGGVEEELARLLGKFGGRPMTYAGGIASQEDLKLLKELGGGRLDFTVGSALDLFGGGLPYEKIRSFQ